MASVLGNRFTLADLAVATGRTATELWSMLRDALAMGALTESDERRVAGTLTAAPNTRYTIDWYASPATAGVSAAQAEHWLAAQSVSTDASGTATLAFEYERPIRRSRR